jgi:hypothetical protein
MDRTRTATNLTLSKPSLMPNEANVLLSFLVGTLFFDAYSPPLGAFE